MATKLLVVAALAVSALWAQQGNVIYPIAQQNLDAYQRDQWNKGSGTRTDLAPKFDAPSNIRVTSSVSLGRDDGDTRSRIEPYDASRFKSDNCPMTKEEGQRYARLTEGLQNPGLIMGANLYGVRQMNDASEDRCGDRVGR